MGEVSYEVRFRGKNTWESDARAAVPSWCSEMRAWSPSEMPFGTDEVKARARHNVLVTAGLCGNEIEGIVPFVVEIVKVVRSKKTMGCTMETMLWQYAEPDAIQEGPWAGKAEP